jgi:hypothetical protein
LNFFKNDIGAFAFGAGVSNWACFGGGEPEEAAPCLADLEKRLAKVVGMESNWKNMAGLSLKQGPF